MSFGNTFENELLEHILNNADIPLVGDAAGLLGSATDGNLYLALHTADPGEAGTQATNETAYTGYARKAITRDGSGWDITDNVASPAENQDFDECTASPGAAITHVSVGVASSGATKLLLKGALSPNITMAVGVIPRIKTTSTITLD